MLKIDKKICDKYKPNVGVKTYLKTPNKCARVILFEDNTIMTIKTDLLANSEIENILVNYKQLSLIESHEDKQNRIIKIYNCAN